MAKKKQRSDTPETRRRFTEEFKQEAVQMLVDGHSAASVAANLGLKSTNNLYRWKAEILAKGGQATESLEAINKDLRSELARTRKERDVLKKALAIFSQQE